MKKLFLLVFILCLIFPLESQYGNKPPLRYAKEVNRVMAGYSGANWIVSPNEEARGDQKVSNARECDIRAVASVNDARRLRVDIYLHNPLTYRYKVYYAFKVIYKYGSYDTYIYFPTTKKFYFGKWSRDGRLLESRTLARDSYGDTCFITASYIRGVRKPNTVIALVLDKDKHISKIGRGTKKYLSARFFTGFVKKGTEGKWTRGIRVADSTMDVRLGFVR